MVTGFEDLLNAVKGPSPEALRRATLETFAVYHARIFEGGGASNGGRIGSYSTEPIYVSVASSPKRFSPKGKTGKTKFKSGKPHKSGYFPGGYREFKGAIGRESGFVNLQLTENLKRGTVPDASPGRYVFGFTNQAEADKASGNEKHFSADIFGTTQAEEEMFVRLILKYT